MIEKEVMDAAKRLRIAAHTHEYCPPIRDLIGVEDLDAAYRIQQFNMDLRMAAGEEVVGVKIGLTSEAVQTQLGVDQPDFGMLTDRMHCSENIPIAWNALHQPKAETEIAFVLAHDILREHLTMDGLSGAIDHACVAIEIVGSRIKDWDIRITDTIADNASASHFVIGSNKVSVKDLDLVNCKMVMRRADAIVSEGRGSACMGNPLNAALWLAKMMHQLGTPLKKGQIILSGALGPVVNVNPGDHFVAEIEGLGSVSVSFENA